MTRNLFIGTWKLISYEVRRPDGRVTYPWGQDLIGRLIYTEDGHVSVAMTRADRSRLAAKNFKDGSLEEKAAAADYYISYSGRYETQGSKVTHHVEVSLFPNWMGKEQIRNFEFDGNRLFLSTDPDPNDDKQRTGHLIWERM